MCEQKNRSAAILTVFVSSILRECERVRPVCRSDTGLVECKRDVADNESSTIDLGVTDPRIIDLAVVDPDARGGGVAYPTRRLRKLIAFGVGDADQPQQSCPYTNHTSIRGSQ